MMIWKRNEINTNHFNMYCVKMIYNDFIYMIYIVVSFPPQQTIFALI